MIKCLADTKLINSVEKKQKDNKANNVLGQLEPRVRKCLLAFSFRKIKINI